MNTLDLTPKEYLALKKEIDKLRIPLEERQKLDRVVDQAYSKHKCMEDEL